jgi:hypothetical protein
LVSSVSACLMSSPASVTLSSASPSPVTYEHRGRNHSTCHVKRLMIGARAL